jgi:hypothetical protein
MSKSLDVSDRQKKHDTNTAAAPLRRPKNRARWPLSTNTTATLLATVERQKSDLNLVLVASVLCDSASLRPFDRLLLLTILIARV